MRFSLLFPLSSETVDATELAFSFLVGSNGILQSRTFQTSVTSSDLLNNNRGLSIRDSIFGGSKCLTGTASTILWSFSFRSYSFCRSLKRQIKIMFPVSERKRQATNGTMMIQFISETVEKDGNNWELIIARYCLGNYFVRPGLLQDGCDRMFVLEKYKIVQKWLNSNPSYNNNLQLRYRTASLLRKIKPEWKPVGILWLVKNRTRYKSANCVATKPTTLWCIRKYTLAYRKETERNGREGESQIFYNWRKKFGARSFTILKTNNAGRGGQGSWTGRFLRSKWVARDWTRIDQNSHIRTILQVQPFCHSHIHKTRKKSVLSVLLY